MHSRQNFRITLAGGLPLPIRYLWNGQSVPSHPGTSEETSPTQWTQYFLIVWPGVRAMLPAFFKSKACSTFGVISYCIPDSRNIESDILPNPEPWYGPRTPGVCPAIKPRQGHPQPFRHFLWRNQFAFLIHCFPPSLLFKQKKPPWLKIIHDGPRLLKIIY